MSWMTTAGTAIGSIWGPVGAAVGGAIGGALDGSKEQKKIDEYNAGQEKMGKYSYWTGKGPQYNYNQPSIMGKAVQGGAQGYMFGQSGAGQGMQKMGQSWLQPSQASSITSGAAMQGGAQSQMNQGLLMQDQGATGRATWMNPQMTMNY